MVEGRQDSRAEQRETFSKTVRIGSNGILDIVNLSGNIEVRRGGGNDAVIEVTKIARGRTTEAAQELLPLVTVDITSRGDRAEIRTNYAPVESRQRRGVNVSVNYAITAPQGTRVRAVTLSGNLRATDIHGELALTTTSGNVQITNAERVAAAKSTSGTVELTNVNSELALEAGTVSGDVVARSVKARRLTLGTVSGNVVAHDVQTERLAAKAFSGNVDFSGTLSKVGQYELTSHSGDVRLTVPSTAGFTITANSWSGNIHSDFAIEGAGPASDRGRRKVVNGVVGDGSASVMITTFSGSIHLSKR
jgi:DUF4097 and DUF4098 domain-containing protein YvlB